MPALMDKSCKRTEYYTPPHVLEAVREYFNGTIHLDPATSDTNPVKACCFRTKDSVPDGLKYGWHGNVFINPPYGKALRQWCRKIDTEARKGVHIIALLPGQRFEQAYWQEQVLNPYLNAICFIRKRLSFLDENGEPIKGNPYGSMLYLYNGDWQHFAEIMHDELGLVLVLGPGSLWHQA